MLRRWRAAWPRRGRWSAPPWPQGPQTQPFPVWTEQAGSRPRWLPRPRRGRLFDVPPAVAAPPVPSYLDPAGARPRWLARLRRARFAEPAWPQGPLNVWTAAVDRPHRARPAFAVRRGRFLPVPSAVPVTTVPTFGDQAGSRPRWAARLLRGRWFQPPWPQGPQNTWTPGTTARRTAVRVAVLPRRGRFLPVPPAQLPTAAPGYVRQATGRRLLARPRQGQYAEPPWLFVPPPPYRPDPTRQPGWRPRWPQLRLCRGRFFEPAWPYLTSTLAAGVGAGGQPPRHLGTPRRGRFFAPPIPPVPVVSVPGFTRLRVASPVAARRRVRFAQPPWPYVPPPATVPGFPTVRRPPTRVIRRASITQPPTPAVPPQAPPALARSRVRPGLLPRRGRFTLPLPSVIPPVLPPAFTRLRLRLVLPFRRGTFTPVVTPPTVPVFVPAAGRRFRCTGLPTRRGRFLPAVPPPAAAPPPPHLAARRRPPPLARRGRYAQPPWPQGPQTVWRPPFRPQPGWRPRWPTFRMRRGDFAEPPWPPPPPFSVGLLTAMSSAPSSSATDYAPPSSSADTRTGGPS